MDASPADGGEGRGEGLGGGAVAGRLLGARLFDHHFGAVPAEAPPPPPRPDAPDTVSPPPQPLPLPPPEGVCVEGSEGTPAAVVDAPCVESQQSPADGARPAAKLHEDTHPQPAADAATQDDAEVVNASASAAAAAAAAADAAAASAKQVAAWRAAHAAAMRVKGLLAALLSEAAAAAADDRGVSPAPFPALSLPSFALPGGSSCSGSVGGARGAGEGALTVEALGQLLLEAQQRQQRADASTSGSGISSSMGSGSYSGAAAEAALRRAVRGLLLLPPHGPRGAAPADRGAPGSSCPSGGSVGGLGGAVRSLVDAVDMVEFSQYLLHIEGGRQWKDLPPDRVYR